jgi:Adenosylmethionine-8-amino-7-oxononanoate aminotransferase
MGAYMKAALSDALGDHPNVGEIRGEGLMCAVELVADRTSRRFFEPAGKVAPQVVAAMVKRGVIARAMPQGDIIGFAPPLCITQAEVDIVVDAVREAIAEVI